jgi:hypothetical protein
MLMWRGKKTRMRKQKPAIMKIITQRTEMDLQKKGSNDKRTNKK